MNRNLAGFLKRQSNGFGRYLGPQEIAKIRPTSAFQILAKLYGARFLPGGRSGGVLAHGFGIGGKPELCNPRIYVDGEMIRDTIPSQGSRRGGIALDQNVMASSVRAVEVYRNPHQAPSEFQTGFMGDCPVVVIWTDYGFGLGRMR